MQQTIILSILYLLTQTLLYSNDLFVYDTYNPVEMNEVSAGNKLLDLEVIKGNTYSLVNNLNIKTTTNSFVSYVLPNRVSIYQGASSAAYFNYDAAVTYDDDFKLPSVVRIKDYAFNFSCNGEVYCVSESTNQMTISTSMCNVTFSTAALFIKSGEKYTHIYVVDGNAFVFDSKSRRKKELKSGDYCVLTPRPLLSPRENSGIVLMGTMFSSRMVEDDEKSLYSQQMIMLKNQLDNTLFVGLNKTNIFGLRLKK